MKIRSVEAFNVSLCKYGLIGGMLYMKDGELVYCTNKLTVPENIRRLHIPYSRISGVDKAPFNTLLITLKNGETYRFLVFSREKIFRKIYDNLKK